MKKVLAIVLLGALLVGLCSCTAANSIREDPNTKMEKALQGEWIMKAYPDNPIYTFLRFQGKNVRYGTNLFGQEVESGTWDCTYTINGTALELTTSDGTVFEFKIQKDGDEIRIFSERGYEFIRTN